MSVNNDALKVLLSEVREDDPASPVSKVSGRQTDVPEGTWTDDRLEAELKDAGVEIFGSTTKRGTREFYITCPNKDAHTVDGDGHETKVYVWHGWPVFKCHHSHCTDLGFQEFAEAVGIQYKKSGRLPGPEGSNYRIEFFEYNKEGVPSKVIEPKVTDWICKNYDFFILGELPYFMNRTGCYVLDEGGVEMKSVIQSHIVPRLCTSAEVNSIYHMVLFQRSKKKRYDDLNQYPVDWVPFRNGFFVPDQNKMMPILPEHFLINQIQHDFDPDAETKCPVFDELLEYQLPEPDDRELWLEFAGSCFNRDTAGQKWMIIRGSGGTGKSTQLNVLIDCIGAENVSGETLQGLNERFAATALFGKLVNISADISSEDLKKVDVLKKITGEDRNGVKHERKGRDSFFFTPFCKLLFSANEVPLNRDEKSNAFYRRLLIIVMDRKPDRVDRNLQKKLRAEVDGIIHRYMEALRRFYERGGLYPESERSQQEVLRLRRAADSVIAFFDDELARDPDHRIERGELYDAYQEYCQREERLYPVTRNRFYDRLRSEGLRESKTHSGRYFDGIVFQTDLFIPVDAADLGTVPFD